MGYIIVKISAERKLGLLYPFSSKGNAIVSWIEICGLTQKESNLMRECDPNFTTPNLCPSVNSSPVQGLLEKETRVFYDVPGNSGASATVLAKGTETLTLLEEKCGYKVVSSSTVTNWKGKTTHYWTLRN